MVITIVRFEANSFLVMLSALKHILFCNLFLFCVIYLNAQNTTSDYSPSQLISYGLDAPGRMAIDTDDNIYVTDAIQKSIVKYNAQGNYISTINSGLSPLSIAVNNKNQLFIGAKETGSIYKVSPNGSKTLFYEGTSMPNSMVFGSNNILYVVDSKQKKVIGLDVSGAVVKEFTYGTFTFPTGIAFDHQNNHIIVSEHGGIGEDMVCGGGCSLCWSTTGPQTSIYIFDLEGNHLISFGCFGTADGLFQRIQGITVGACGNIYATDPYLGRVSVFDDNGNYITKFGLHGDGAGELNLPMDIVFNSNNNIYVSSMNKGAIDVFSITQALPTATITSTDEIICTGTTTDIAVAFTGTAPWTFTYTINGLNPQIKTVTESPYTLPVSEEGLYEITSLADGNGVLGTCFTGSARVQVSTAPPTATIITTDFSKCSDDSTGIDIEFTGIAPWLFTYTINGLNPTEITVTENSYHLDVINSGLYEIIALTDAGCTGTSFIGNPSVTVHPLPSAIFSSDDDGLFINPGEIVDISISFTGNAPYTFTYYKDSNKADVISITTSDNPYMLTVSDEDTYEISSIADLNCSNNEWQDYFDIAFNDIVPPTATIETSYIHVCPGVTANLAIDFTGVSPWTFGYTINGLNPVSISTSANPYVLSASLPGVYELSAVSDQNTTGTFSGTANVVLLEQPIVNLPEEIFICEGDPVYVLDAGDHESYLWSDGSTNRTLEVSATDIYSVTVTNSSGCTASDSVSVTVLFLPDAYFYYDVNTLEVQFVNNSFNADTHYWDFGDGTSSTEENPIHNYASKGNYTVTYTALSNYCGSSVFTETVNVGGKSTSELIDIYPNPSTGKFTILISPNELLLGTINILINSMSGQYLYSGTYNPNMVTSYNGNYYIDVNIDHFNKGIYIVYINAGNFVGQDKLILKD